MKSDEMSCDEKQTKYKADSKHSDLHENLKQLYDLAALSQNFRHKSKIVVLTAFIFSCQGGFKALLDKHFGSVRELSMLAMEIRAVIENKDNSDSWWRLTNEAAPYWTCWYCLAAASVVQPSENRMK